MELDNNHKITLIHLLKNRIKNLPLIGFVIRFLNTFIHLNHLKFKVYTQEKCILNLKCIVQDQEKRFQDQEKRFQDQLLILENSFVMLQKDIKLISKDLERTDNIINSIDQSIASHIYYQLHSVQHRLDLLESKTISL